jgi:biopolymer transport protein ExbB
MPVFPQDIPWTFADSSASGGLGAASDSVIQFFISGGIFMPFLLLLSLLAIAVIIHKARGLRRSRVLPEPVAEGMRRAEDWSAAGRLDDLAEVMRTHPSPLGRIGEHALVTHFESKEEARGGVQANAREEIVHLESGIALLEVVITVAPLLGLLGTVSGLVGVFSDLSGAGEAEEHARIARGIAEALNTTIAGLAVAVPTVFAHSYFTKKIEKMAVRMEVLTGHLVNILFRRPEPEAALHAVESSSDELGLFEDPEILYHPAPSERSEF